MYLLQLSELVAGALCQVPIGLQEVVVHLVNQDTRHRPSARTLVQISYFGSVLCSADTVNIIDNIIIWYMQGSCRAGATVLRVH